MATLRFYQGNELLFEYRLRAGPNRIGRADSCDVALPGEAISRTHCVVQGARDEWVVIDRSRHGVIVDGQKISDRGRLVDGSLVRIGPYRVEVGLMSRDARPTAPREPDRSHEALLVADGALHIERARMHVEQGPDRGRTYDLCFSRMSVGGKGSTIELTDESLAPEHCWLRIARGRVMVEPGRGPALIDSQRVRAITPLYLEETLTLGTTVVRVSRETRSEALVADSFGDMVAESEAMKHIFGTLRRVSGHHHTVLIVGESGTGKELAARGIHDHSPRAERPYVALNCGAISTELFESELFGHEKGAFTGADRRRDGAFHDAAGGTLFLDEVGELPEAAQAKLLRVLETGEVRRVGSTRVSFPDVRIVAATNRDLVEAVSTGLFREDLFYRLAVLAVEIPPLRDRTDDIAILCRTLCRALDPQAHVTPRALEVLRRHDWPGNVRELRNVLTRAVVLGGSRVDSEDLTFHRLASTHHVQVDSGAVEANERAYLLAVLKRHGDNQSSAARELGLARSTLHYKLRKLGIV